MLELCFQNININPQSILLPTYSSINAFALNGSLYTDNHLKPSGKIKTHTVNLPSISLRNSLQYYAFAATAI